MYAYQVNLPVPPQPTVVINEVMADNAFTAQDSYNEAEDWIELHNPTGAPVDLSGWFLSDTPFDLYKWPIPSGTVLNANDYLIVWADEDGWQGPLHANFKLSADGEAVRLVNADSMQVDLVTFGAQTEDLGHARVPNGFGPFVVQQPTFAANNNSVGLEENAAPVLGAFPNPTSTGFTLLTGTNEPMDVEVYDALARRVWSGRVTGRADLDASGWSTGTYTVRCGTGALRLVVAR